MLARTFIRRLNSSAAAATNRSIRAAPRAAVVCRRQPPTPLSPLAVNAPAAAASLCRRGFISATAYRSTAAAASAAPASDIDSNPLLQPGLPRFSAVRAEHVAPAVQHVIARIESELSALEGTTDPNQSTASRVIESLERWNDDLSRAWGVVTHLKSVRDTKELRAAIEAVQPSVVAIGLKIGQSQAVYDALNAVASNPQKLAALSVERQRIVHCLLRDARLSGVSLRGAERERFNHLQSELAAFGMQFANAVLDSTKRFVLVCTTKDEVSGVPANALAIAAEIATSRGLGGAGGKTGKVAMAEAGPWAFTLDAPMITPFLSYAHRRDLRERLARAAATRASGQLIHTDPASGNTTIVTATVSPAADGSLPAGVIRDADNTALIHSILRTRTEMASLLGFANYAEYSLAVNKQVPRVGDVYQFLNELQAVSFAGAHSDHAKLTQFARAESGDPKLVLAQWDIAYWSERLRAKEFDFNDETLRPYFPLPQVLSGLFDVVQRLFGVTIREVKSGIDVWHPTVQYFEVLKGNTPIAGFYTDMYSRPSEKQGGAWMNVCIQRSKALLSSHGSEYSTVNKSGARVRMPIAYLICNQSPPTVDPVTGVSTPSLMTFREVETLFHEFGHVSQHILTDCDESLVSGLANVEWDAVELPSQLMENFCYDRGTIRGLSRHVTSGESIPDSLFNKLVGARQYRAATAMCRQLLFSTIDMDVHSQFEWKQKSAAAAAGGDTYAPFTAIEQRVASTTSVLKPLPESRLLCSFAHIFAGGYAAGYYSYKWAEVMSADAFEAFADVLESPQQLSAVGERYRSTVLGLGGSMSAAKVFELFRGRAPSVNPLLKQAGLLSATPAAK